MLAASVLGKRFETKWIFRRLQFELGRGERLAIVGRNGSGKSTLLKVLAGLLPPSEGRVIPPDGDGRTSVGYAALELALYGQLTALEHLQFAARVRGCQERGEELLARVGLAAAPHLAAARMSSGMKARLKLAIAIQPRPAVLLLDEPGASLDAEGRELLQAIADEQAERGCLVVATNDPGERRLATHELRLD